jgi:fumarate reductase flavoprotein subunit
LTAKGPGYTPCGPQYENATWRSERSILTHDTLVAGAGGAGLRAAIAEWFVTALLVEEGRCQGVAALELRTGQVRGIAARPVILATGGAGRIFPFTTNAAINTGDGMALAYRAGVPLKDMEFVQYHPTGLPGSGILITEAARGEGGILVNRDGYRYLQDYDLGRPLDVHDPRHPQKAQMELGPRDRVSQAFIHEREKGRTVQTPHGDAVYLDLRHLGEETIERKIPFVRELATSYAGIDPVHAPIPVRPVVHQMMAGVHTDSDGATPLPGLFAAGECACVSINGANRLGSNSLAEILVFGARAGRAAARFAAAHAVNECAVQSQPADEQQRLAERFFTGPPGRETIHGVRVDLNRAMEAGAGIFRSEEGLCETCGTIRLLKERYRDVGLTDRSLSFNTELTAVLELGFLLDAAEAVAHSALARRESRGAHQRLDHPRRDDDLFLCHSLAYRTDEEPRIDTLDVVITRWPPKERLHGRT